MMQNPERFGWLTPVRLGLIGGTVAVLLALIGMIGTFSERPIVSGLVSLGHTLLFAIIFLAAQAAAERTASAGKPPTLVIAAGAVAGLIVTLLVALLVV